MQKFLVIQTAFIGDAILATGIIEKLHVFFPDAEIDFLVRKGNESLLKGHPYLHQVLIWDKKKGKLKNLFKLFTVIRQRRYNKVINIQRFAATGILTAFSGAGETIGFNKNPFSRAFSVKKDHIISQADKPKHEIERNNELIEHFTDGKPFRPRLYPSVNDFLKVAHYKSVPYICIAPASVWFTKQYPAEKWVSFILLLKNKYAIYLLGGKEDYELCAGIEKNTPGATCINLAGQLNFLESCALMKDAVMNYVNDSAPMHLASAVNAPVTAVYCSTMPYFGFGPLSDTRFIVEVQELLPCRPCGLHGRRECPLGHFKCAYNINDAQLPATLPES